MAAYVHVDVPGSLLPQLGRLLAEFEKDGRRKTITFFFHFNVNSNLGPPSSVQVGRMVKWMLAKPPGNHVTPWWLKAKDAISGRTVTFGETRHKKVHARPHMWVAATPSVAQRMAPLLRNFLAGRLQAPSQTAIFAIQFLYANKTRILRAFLC